MLRFKNAGALCSGETLVYTLWVTKTGKIFREYPDGRLEDASADDREWVESLNL